MKRKITYESETILPVEIERLLNDTQEYVLAHKYEGDKVIIDFSWLKRELIRWFDDHAKE
jgi:hypothetical protein